jgi:hypothetical protein
MATAVGGRPLTSACPSSWRAQDEREGFVRAHERTTRYLKCLNAAIATAGKVTTQMNSASDTHA